MAGCELKTEVFGILQTFKRHIPAEELLRRYDEIRNHNGSEPQPKQEENAMAKLKSSYSLLVYEGISKSRGMINKVVELILGKYCYIFTIWGNDIGSNVLFDS
ncbi:ImpA domain protein [Escherichia coli]|nr:ImpA domain protein [Escherichia coli]